MGAMKDIATGIDEVKIAVYKMCFPMNITKIDGKEYAMCPSCKEIMEIKEEGYGVDKDALSGGMYDDYYYKCPNCGDKISY